MATKQELIHKLYKIGRLHLKNKDEVESISLTKGCEDVKDKVKYNEWCAMESETIIPLIKKVENLDKIESTAQEEIDKQLKPLEKEIEKITKNINDYKEKKLSVALLENEITKKMDQHMDATRTSDDKNLGEKIMLLVSSRIGQNSTVTSENNNNNNNETSSIKPTTKLKRG